MIRLLKLLGRDLGKLFKDGFQIIFGLGLMVIIMIFILIIIGSVGFPILRVINNVTSLDVGGDLDFTKNYLEQYKGDFFLGVGNMMVLGTLTFFVLAIISISIYGIKQLICTTIIYISGLKSRIKAMERIKKE